MIKVSRPSYLKSPVKISGLRVEVKDGNVEKAIKIFSKKVQASGKLKEYKERGEFVKPSVKRRMARKAAVIRSRQQNKDHQE